MDLYTRTVENSNGIKFKLNLTRSSCVGQTSTSFRPLPFDAPSVDRPAYWAGSRRRRPARLMPEMPDAGEDHGDAVIVRGLDDVVVAHRTARLNHRRRAGLDCHEKSVREWEECV